MTTLSTFTTRVPITAAQAIEDWSVVLGDGAVALLYTPSEARILRMDRPAQGLERLSDPHGKGARVSQAWGLRLFSASGELRWQHDSGGAGAAVFLTDADISPSTERWVGPSSRECEATLDQRYILWGTPSTPVTPEHPLAEGWTRLADAQVGPIRVPCDIPSHHVAVLRAKEYLARDPDHGNVFVAAELLCGIEAARAHDEAKPTTQKEE